MSNKRKSNFINDQVSKKKSPSKTSCDDKINDNLNFDCPLNLNFVDDKPIILVERREFVEYQNKTNININNMISYLSDLGNNFQKTNELIVKQAKHINELENELKSLRGVLNITKKGKKYERNQISKIDTKIKDHNYTTINNENLNLNESKNSKNNEIIDHINESIERTINSINSTNNDTINDTNSNTVSDTNNNTINDTNNNATSPTNSKLNDDLNNDLVELYPNSKLLVNRKRLSKCLKSCSYTAFVSKMLTGLFSVEDVFMKNLKGGKSISIFGLQKRSFPKHYVDEIYNSVKHYFPNQIENAKNEWEKEINKSINSKLFVLNKHLCGLILKNEDLNKRYKLGKLDVEHFRNYEKYRSNPDNLKNLLIEIYGEQALDLTKNLNISNQFNDTESNEYEFENQEESDDESYEINYLEKNEKNDSNNMNNINDNVNDNVNELDNQRLDKNNFIDVNSLNITQFQEAVILDPEYFNVLSDYNGPCTDLNNDNNQLIN